MRKFHTIPKLRVRSWPSRTRILLGPSWDPVPQRPTMIGGGKRPGIPDIWGYHWGWCQPDLGRHFRFIVPTSWRSLKIIENPFVQVVELTLSCTWESLGQLRKLRSVCRNPKELSRIGALGWRWHSHWAEGLAQLMQLVPESLDDLDDLDLYGSIRSVRSIRSLSYQVWGP